MFFCSSVSTVCRSQPVLRRSAQFVILLAGAFLLSALQCEGPEELPKQDASSQAPPPAPDAAAAETKQLLQRVSTHASAIEEETGSITETAIRTGDLDGDDDTDAVVEVGIGADEYSSTLQTHAVFYERTDRGWKKAGERTMDYCASFQEISPAAVVVERRSCATYPPKPLAVHRYAYRDGTLQKKSSTPIGTEKRLADLLSAIGTIRSNVGGVMGHNPKSIEGQDAEQLDRLADTYATLQNQRRALYREAIETVAEKRRPSRRALAARVERRLSEAGSPIDSVEAVEDYRPATPWVNRALVVHTRTTLETDETARWIAWPLLQKAPGVEADSTGLPEGRASPPAGSVVFDVPVEPGNVGIERIVVEGPDRRVAVRVEDPARDADRAARRLAENSDIDRDDIGDLRAVLSAPAAFEDLLGDYPSRTCPSFTWFDGKNFPFLTQTARWVHLSDPQRPELAVFTYGCSKESSTHDGLLIAKGTVSGGQMKWTQVHEEGPVTPSDVTIATDAEGRAAMIIADTRQVGGGAIRSMVQSVITTGGTYKTVEVARYYEKPCGMMTDQYRAETIDEVRVGETDDKGIRIDVTVERAVAPIPDTYDSYCDALDEWEPPEPTVEVDWYLLSDDEVRAVDDASGSEQVSGKGPSLAQLLRPDEIAPQEGDPATASYTVPAEEDYYADRPLTREALRGKSLRRLTLLRTTILAGAGYTFEVDWLDEHFRGRDWYEPGGFALDSIPARDLKNAKRIKAVEDDLTFDQLLARRAIHWVRPWVPVFHAGPPQTDWTPPGPFADRPNPERAARKALLLNEAIAERRENGAERSPPSVPKGFGNGLEIGAPVDALPRSFDGLDDNIQAFWGRVDPHVPQDDGMIPPGKKVAGTIDDEGRIEQIIVRPYPPRGIDVDLMTFGAPTGFGPIRWEGEERGLTIDRLHGPAGATTYLVLHNGEPDRVCGPEDGFDKWITEFKKALKSGDAERAAAFVRVPFDYERPPTEPDTTLQSREAVANAMPLPTPGEATCVPRRGGYKAPVPDNPRGGYHFRRVNGEWKAVRIEFSLV